MGNTVVMFPGQGSQVMGMGQDFYDNYDVSRKMFDKAAEITGIDLKHLIFEADENLNKTEYTQIALYVTEMIMLEALKEKGLTFDYAVGLSLGEYGALTACGGIDYEDCVSLVRNRGIYMEQAVPAGVGTMAAVLGLTGEEVENALKAAGFEDVCVANFNCPGQIVISGEKNNVLKAMEMLKESGARRVLELNVSGPFHSPLLKDAGDKLSKDLEETKLMQVKIPYVANLTADFVDENTTIPQIRELLAAQVYSSVRFEQSVRNLINKGCDTFIEVGPGKTLTGFLKKITKDMGVDNIKLINVEKIGDCDGWIGQ
ncbi:MAG: ACP S-malonyltransferase [Eubacteriales bacterium]|nr:ACP S-malonyltransferase [Eubacteriales bacterium]